MSDPDLFSLPEYRKGRHKSGDWSTSVAGAESVAYRAGSQKAKLLQAFQDAHPESLTDEEAAERAGISLSSEYSKRCGELRQDGHIAVLRDVNGHPVTREGRSGIARLLSVWQSDPKPLPNTGSMKTRVGNPKGGVVLTERQADVLIDGQRVLVGQVARTLETLTAETPQAAAERVIETVADWLSDYRPQDLGSEYVGPLDMTAFILRRGRIKE
jgi:hypothetical protein